MQILKKLQLPIDAKEEEEVPAHHIINGQNVVLWPVRDGQQFDLDLMTMMFKKEEMVGHLCFKSKMQPLPKPNYLIKG